MPEYTEYLRRRSIPPSDLNQIISEARSRWRTKLALKGAVRVVGIALALLLVAAYGMEWARFSATSIITARVLMAAALVASIFYFLVQPLEAARHRRTGGVVSRGARSVTAGHACQRRRGESGRQRRYVSRAREAAGRAGDRDVCHHERRAACRGSAVEALGRSAGGRHRRRTPDSCCSVRGSCAMRCRHSFLFSAALKPQRRTALKSRRATPPCPRVRTRRSARGSRDLPPRTRRS